MQTNVVKPVLHGNIKSRHRYALHCPTTYCHRRNRK